jgi:putative CocE/NonD family hydrolase
MPDRLLSLISRFVGWRFKLPPAETYDVVVERDIPVPMPDGVTLLADHYYPRGGGAVPTVLVRSPYGRAGLVGLLFARPFAERGFGVLIQSCRGTFGSGGPFDALRNERGDGLATLAWLEAQPWFTGALATVGPSYLGLVQWAIARDAGPLLKAMAPQITASSFRSMTYPGETFGLDTALTWIQLMSTQERGWRSQMGNRRAAEARLRAAHDHLPLETADVVATGAPVPYYRDWLAHNEPGDPWWQPMDFSATVGEVAAPATVQAGWYDIFLPFQLADYARLRQAGRRPYLTIGPWVHTAPAQFPVALRESILLFRAHLLGDRSGLRRAPVRVFVMGRQKWRNLPDWPPAGYASQPWYLHPGGALALAPPPASAPDHYRYDPANPTPSPGGASLSTNSGPRDNRALEARADVLVYSSAPLDRAVEAIGPVGAEIAFASSLEHTDLCLRLCDVAPSGKSINISDGVLRLRPDCPPAGADGSRRVRVELWPTAYLFRPGHRIRLIVASAAHPRWARNPGSGEPLATATRLVPADQTVYHDPEHPSVLLLPVRATTPRPAS